MIYHFLRLICNVQNYFLKDHSSWMLMRRLLEIRSSAPTTLIWLKSRFIPSSRGVALSVLTFWFCMQGHVCHLPLLPFYTCHTLFAPTLTLLLNFPSHLKRIYRWKKRKQAGAASLNNSTHSRHPHKQTFIPQSSPYSLASRTRLSSILMSMWPFGRAL